MSLNDPLTDAVNRFAASVDANAVETRELSGVINESERRRRRAEIVGGVVGVLLLLMVGGIIWLLSIVVNTQGTIKDCTDPARPSATCARRAQENTVRVLATIRRDQVASVYVSGLCRPKADTDAEYTACMDRELGNVANGKLKVPGIDK